MRKDITTIYDLLVRSHEICNKYYFANIDIDVIGMAFLESAFVQDYLLTGVDLTSVRKIIQERIENSAKKILTLEEMEAKIEATKSDPVYPDSLRKEKGMKYIASMNTESSYLMNTILKFGDPKNINIISVATHARLISDMTVLGRLLNNKKVLDRANQLAIELNKRVNKSSNSGDAQEKSDKKLSFLTEYTRHQEFTSREEESELEFICLRKYKKNAIVVGQAGIGKTSFCYGFFNKVRDSKTSLDANTKIFEFSMASFMAGTMMRGEIEGRVESLFKELNEMTKTHGKIILFIDEIHSLTSVGGVNSPPLMDLFKPHLKESDLIIIGCTTEDEYLKHFNKDEAFKRRFSMLSLNPPGESVVKNIINDRSTDLSNFHSLKCSDENIEYIIKTTPKYFLDRVMPDVAIDVLDNSFAMAKLKNEEAVQIEHINSCIEKLSNKKIKDHNLSLSEKRDLRSNHLKDVIKGQDLNIDEITKSIMVKEVGLGDVENTTLGNFILAGKSGVGKTATVLELSKMDDFHFVRFDLSEYEEKHSISKLIGAPPGYAGFDQGGILTNEIEKHPRSIILFDEVEKAHPDFQNILLQILGSARLTSSTGKVTDFSNCMVFLTTNLGTGKKKRNSISLAENKEKSSHEVDSSEIYKYFKPEVMGRIDKIVYFNGIDEDVAREILFSKIKKLTNGKWQINPTDIAVDEILKSSNFINYGGRDIEKAVSRVLSEAIISKMEESAKLSDVMTLNYTDNEGFYLK
jgi:ATP-dependent Clp protease ATP-binding subunit ClpA